MKLNLNLYMFEKLLFHFILIRSSKIYYWSLTCRLPFYFVFFVSIDRFKCSVYESLISTFKPTFFFMFSKNFSLMNSPINIYLALITVDYSQFELEPDRPLVLVTCSKYRPDPILCRRLGFKFDGAARVFTVPGLS